MRIETYFRRIQKTIESCPVVRLTSITYEKRGTYEGFIRGELYFADSSILHLREFLDVESSPERIMYAYQYITASDKLIFRYDNTRHHKKLGLPNYPHHKHERNEDNVISSLAPDLAGVLREIGLLIQI